MTKQIPDLLIYLGEEFRLAGTNGARLPTPEYFGLARNPDPPTNCYRGYVAKYVVADSCLLISTLTVTSFDAPPLNGIEPVVETDLLRKGWRTYSLGLRTEFSGGIIVGRDFVGKLYGLGHPSPHSYLTVLELIFADGVLQTVHNRSAIAARIREMFAQRPRGYQGPDPQASMDFREKLEQDFAAGCTYRYESIE